MPQSHGRNVPQNVSGVCIDVEGCARRNRFAALRFHIPQLAGLLLALLVLAGTGAFNMSGRARVPIGASGRGGLFGNPTTSTTACLSEAGFLSSTQQDSHGVGNRRDDVPFATSASQQQQIGGSVVATPYGVMSPGRRRLVEYILAS